MKSGAVIGIEGIIGAGKSTLVSKLASMLEYRPLYEPVDPDALEEFYRDPKGKAYSFQLRQLVRRHSLHWLAVREAMSNAGFKGSILDRTLPGDRVFAKLHNKAGNISSFDWQTYEMFYRDYATPIPAPTLLIFVDVEPDVAMERIRNRNRGAESGMTLDYLRDLRKGYLDMFSEIDSGSHPWGKVDVMKLPWNSDHQEVSPIVSLIKDKLHIS
jgi:deoxyadenosine/deoxycytidine kinase